MTVEKLTDKLIDIASSLQGPGFEAAKSAAVVSAASNLVAGVLCGVVAAAAAWGFRRAWVHYRTRVRGDFDAELHGSLGMLLCGVCVVLFGAPAIWAVADPWTWTALTQPELWLAKRALGL